MFKNSFLKKCFAVVCGVSFLTGFKICAFNDTAHKYITRSSFEALTRIGQEIEDNEKMKDVVKASEFFKNDEKYYKELLVRYSIQPDIDEIQGMYKYHFYNPVTGTNFMNEEESALKRYKEHFQKAVELYKKGEKGEAYQELGRAVHFMEDMNAPVHTAYELPADAVAKLRLHVEFEKACDKICGECELELIPESLKYFEVNSLDNIARSAATLSADNFYYLEKMNEDKEKISKNAIYNAQKKISGILYKFSKEVTKP